MFPFNIGTKFQMTLYLFFVFFYFNNHYSIPVDYARTRDYKITEYIIKLFLSLLMDDLLI